MGGERPRVPVARPWLGEEELEALRGPLESGWVTQGPEVAAFEAEFAAAVGAPFACAVSNCTAALHLALLATGVGPGDEVVTVSHTFVATANAVVHAGADPIFVDVHPDTFNIDPAEVEKAITARTRAILCVHQMGMPCELPALVEIAARHDVPLIEDAACAVGSQIRFDGGFEPIGLPRGRVACFSFHPRKLVTTGDGGMLTTADPELDAHARLLRHQGMSVSDLERHEASEVRLPSFPVVGFNYRLTDLQAAVGRVQLRRLPELVERRRALIARYHELLGGIDGLCLPVEPEWARSNWQSYCVRLPKGCAPETAMKHLLDRGIASRPGVGCIHREPAYADRTLRHQLPRTEATQRRALVLPLYHSLSSEDQERVVEALREVC